MRQDPVDAILDRHGLSSPWTPLTATGVANRIYATRDVVVRVATDHRDGFSDARTESVAAPVARAAGIPVPRLLVFDDSRTLVDRPYTIWERVHGETLGLFAPDPNSAAETWRDVGRQLALLHLRVDECPDPNGWLDEADREADLETPLDALASRDTIDASLAREVRGWIDILRPAIAVKTATKFLHNDMHAMNVMCDRAGGLLAIIDWGDAGWGDPVLEVAQVSIAAVPFVLEGYRREAPELLGDDPEARIAWDKLGYFLDRLQRNRAGLDEVSAIRALIHR